VYNGTYTEKVTPSVNLAPSSTNGLFIQNHSGEAPVIDATGLTNGVYIGSLDYVTVQGFTIHGSTDACIYTEGNYNTITYNRVYGSTAGSGIVLNNASNTSVTNNLVTDNYNFGVRLINSSNSVVKNNTLANDGHVSKAPPLPSVYDPAELYVESGTGTTVQNNIFYAKSGTNNYTLKTEAGITVSSDYNTYFKNGNNMSYHDLFEKYKKLRVEFGIIKDVIHDKDSTLESAMEAIEIYESNDYPEAFKLVGVAQGKSVEDYVACYEKLSDMGYEYIAIGGLLKRNANTNYVRVRCETFLKKVLEAINKEFNPKWLFVLGAYHPKRHELLESFNVWGSDYKGWLYCYDESYGNSIRELSAQDIIDSTVEEIYNKFIETKQKYFRTKRNYYRIKYFQLREWLDERLKVFGLSLQELRFREVRKNLEQNVISKMLNKNYSISTP
jgi:parallel beta-helix repeat protein